LGEEEGRWLTLIRSGDGANHITVCYTVKRKNNGLLSRAVDKPVACGEIAAVS
jgi:hypothetical protein